jgi:hypothetical protein
MAVRGNDIWSYKNISKLKVHLLRPFTFCALHWNMKCTNSRFLKRKLMKFSKYIYSLVKFLDDTMLASSSHKSSLDFIGEVDEKVSPSMLHNACKYIGVRYIILVYPVEEHNIHLENKSKEKLILLYEITNSSYIFWCTRFVLYMFELNRVNSCRDTL